MQYGGGVVPQLSAVFSPAPVTLHPTLIHCSSIVVPCRSFTSYQQMWQDKQHVLQEPDVLLLSSGTEIAYRTPLGWSIDAAWGERLGESRRSGWHLQRVQDAVADMLQERSTAAAVNNGTTGEGETHGRPSQQRGDVHHPALPSPRVKLDTAKQQGPYRVRLLVAGGVANAAAVVLQLERHLAEQAEAVQAVHQKQRLLRQQEQQTWDVAGLPLQQQQAKANDAAHSWRQHPTPPTLRTHASRPMSWRVLVHRHVEGGGPAHLGWAAVDVVPERAGPAWALRHVAGRFGLQLGLLASCMEAASGDHELVSELCGLGSVRVGPPTRSAFSATAASAGGAAESSLATAAYGPSAIPEGLSGRGNSVNSGSGVYQRVAAAPTVMPTLTGPRSIMDGLVSLGLV